MNRSIFPIDFSVFDVIMRVLQYSPCSLICPSEMHDWGRDNHRVFNGIFGYSGRDSDFLVCEDADEAKRGVVNGEACELHSSWDFNFEQQQWCSIERSEGLSEAWFDSDWAWMALRSTYCWLGRSMKVRDAFQSVIGSCLGGWRGMWNRDAF